MTPNEVVFLIDVDNTLLDNDRVIADLGAEFIRTLGEEAAKRYWATFETLREECGYADYLGAIQRFRDQTSADRMTDSALLQMAGRFADYPFAERLYPDALRVIERLRARGPTAILSDGDAVHQPRKITRSGLWQAVDGHVMIFIHKELMLSTIEARYPARHYVLIDDKLRILIAMKALLGKRLTTVFPRQGHFAHDIAALAGMPPADVTVEAIGDLLNLDLDRLIGST